MPRKYTGDYSKASLKSVEYANTLQALAIESIKKSFNSEIELDLNSMTLGEFMEALSTADANGTRAEFEAKLAAQIGPVIDMVEKAQQPQQPAQSIIPSAPPGYRYGA